MKQLPPKVKPQNSPEKVLSAYYNSLIWFKLRKKNHSHTREYKTLDLVFTSDTENFTD